MKQIISMIFIFVFINPGYANPKIQYGTLEGTIADAANQQALAGADIEIIGTHQGASSNAEGYFLINPIPIGIYQVRVSMMGYQSQIQTEIIVATNRTTNVTFKLKPVILEMNENIEVTTDYFYQDGEKPVSSKSLTPQEIRFSAGSAEDIFRVIQAMPGVATNGSLSANLIVRGGSPDENRTYLDNVEIYSPLHFARPGTSMGIISIINPALISGVEFISGGFPVEFDDKLSSVFDIKLKEGNHNRINSEFTLNLGGAGSYIEGPLSDDTQLIFSARRGYFDIVTGMMDAPVSPQYWDFITKVSHTPNPSHRISVIGFYYQDDFEKKGYSDNIHHSDGIKYYRVKGQVRGNAAGVNWTYLINDAAYMLTTLSFINNSWQSKRGSETNFSEDRDEISENEFHIKSQINWSPFPILDLKSGIIWKHIDSNHHIWNTVDTTQTGFILPAVSTQYNPDWTYKTGAFLQTTLHPVRKLIITTGIRTDSYQFTNEKNLSPRIGLKYILSGKITINGAHGIYYQTPDAYKVALDPANQVLKSSRAVHTVAGFEFLPSPDTKISLEYYEKDLDALQVEQENTRIITGDGSGYSRGLELYLQRKMSSNFVGSLAYTFAFARRQDGPSLPEYDFQYDQRHNFTLISGYKFSNQWRLGLKYQFATGMPYTPVTGTVKYEDNWYLVEGTPYSARYPDIYKVDMRIDRFFHYNNWTMSVYLDLWNAFNNKTVLFYSYSCDDQGIVTKKANYDFPMLPIFGISAQF